MPDFGSETERDCCGETCGSSAFWGVRWRMLDAGRVDWHKSRKQSQQKMNRKADRKTGRKTGRIQADGRNEGWIKEEEI